MNIGLLGFGVVGGGVWELAQENRALNVKKVLVRREAPSLGKAAVQDVEAILRDTDIDTVVEVLGGLHPAYEWICRALAAGKDVVTANKAVISAYYRELTALAHENGAALRCTAAVGGGIPWLVNLQRCRRVDTVTEVGGIMNGTTNFIMDAMARQGADFPAVLQRAQELGYAEADPSADIDGDDIRRKLTISANIAFDALLREEDIPAFGIRTVTGADMKDFRAHGFTCKLLACAQRTETGVAAYVEPALVTEGEPEAAVPGNYNLISCTGELLGRQSYFGQGAGRYPTAANVVQDCLDLLAGEDGFYTETARPMAVEADAVAHPYYVRTRTADPWLESVTADRWDSGVITGAVPVGQMLRWAAAQRQRDPGCFVAGIR